MSRVALAVLAAFCAAAPLAQAQPGGAPAPAAASTAQPAPRETATAVAEAIEAQYLDPAKGKAVADELRAAAARGDLDRFTDPRDLATALGNRLRPHDAHFNVTWSAEAPPTGGPRPGPGPGPGGHGAGPPPEFLAALRRDNYGLHRVQRLPGNIGYIELKQFVPTDFGDPNDPARRAVDAALTLTSGADALIIDLRDNGGGSPSMVGYITSAFTARDADIYNTFHSRRGTRSEAPGVYHPAPNLTVPVYILTSARTGSAAEALAYTLQAAKRATVVGEASGGAANPGGGFPVRGGFTVFISTGAPINPITRKNWEGTGVAPDVAVPAAQALDRAQALALQASSKGLSGPAVTDNRWAQEALSPPALNPDLATFPGEYSGSKIERHPDGLHYVRGRRPHWILYAIADDLFAVRGEPGRRVRFIRDAKGKVTALEVLTPDGPLGLYRREG